MIRTIKSRNRREYIIVISERWFKKPVSFEQRTDIDIYYIIISRYYDSQWRQALWLGRMA